LPQLRRAPAVARFLAGGWQNNGILTLYSGLPFTVLSGVDNSLSGIGQDRADQVGHPSIAGSRQEQAMLTQYFNPKAFAVNALGTFGTTGRDILRGPGTQLSTGLCSRMLRFGRVRRCSSGRSFSIYSTIPTSLSRSR
jgi:hypothetical protein